MSSQSKSKDEEQVEEIGRNVSRLVSSSQWLHSLLTPFVYDDKPCQLKRADVKKIVEASYHVQQVACNLADSADDIMGWASVHGQHQLTQGADNFARNVGRLRTHRKLRHIEIRYLKELIGYLQEVVERDEQA